MGLSYVPPVATLLRWFPDRRGLATGLTIMGFGGGAIFASMAMVSSGEEGGIGEEGGARGIWLGEGRV